MGASSPYGNGCREERSTFQLQREKGTEEIFITGNHPIAENIRYGVFYEREFNIKKELFLSLFKGSAAIVCFVHINFLGGINMERGAVIDQNC
ncbi:hypothetical protein GCM10007216_36620 [Thalassobacillus devorans]|uniref:Uncharacterized protein n=1 Tax=Thalassobacillus devorans TaxID=279813 RepID=A0ABQ1PSR0_9BACI|nr:hypothetical protein GCM10007216_36620 [Thalassobacillus devorans]